LLPAPVGGETVKRQTLLLAVLAVLALVALPISYLDQTLLRQERELAQLQDKLEPLRKEAATIRTKEEELARRQSAVTAATRRMISERPFATIQGEVVALARQSGVTLTGFSVEGPLAVSELPGVVRYQATVQIAGNRWQFVAFLRLLEQHRLLIEIPEVDLKLPLQVAGGGAEVQQTLKLDFFAVQSKR
jgi:cell division protein FtsB